MKIYLFLLLFWCGIAKAQDAPVKWATQETFFEDLAGKDLPFFTGLSTNGKPFSSGALKNQIVVINFWFEKCPPCIAEMPELNLLASKYKGKNIRFIGLTHDSAKSAGRFQKRNPYNYEIISLTMDEIRKLNINHGFPTNILIGKDGKIIYAMANISFTDDEFKAKSVLFEELLNKEINQATPQK